MDRPIDSFAESSDDGWDPLDDWGDEAPKEPSAAERAAEVDKREFAQADASDLYDEDTQAFIFLLSIAVSRLGGVMAVSMADRAGEYRLGIDQSGLKPGGDGFIRLYNIPAEDA
jgi:hypothetical protein